MKTKDQEYNECFQKIVDTLVKHKLIADTNILSKEKLKELQVQQSLLQNTKKLLISYSGIKRAVQVRLSDEIYEFTGKRKSFEDKTSKEIFEIARSCITNNFFINHPMAYKFEREINSLKRSASILCFVDNALGLIKQSSSYGELSERVINYKYFDNKGVDLEIFIHSEGISKSTFYRCLKESTDMISVMLFGTPSHKISALVNIAMIINESIYA